MRPKGIISLGIILVILAGFFMIFGPVGTTWYYNNAWYLLYGFGLPGIILIIVGIILSIRNSIIKSRNPTPKKFQELSGIEKDEKIEELEKRLEKVEDKKSKPQNDSSPQDKNQQDSKNS